MKKRHLVIFLIIFMLTISFVSAKTIISNSVLPISINKVNIENGQISIFVESKNSYKEYLMFDVKSSDGTTKRYYSNQFLNAYESTYFSIPLDVTNPAYLYVIPYHNSGKDIILYDFSKETYTFTGAEYTSSKTTQTQTTSLAVSTETPYSTVTTTALVNPSTDDKVLYVNGIQKIQDNNVEYLHNYYLGSPLKKTGYSAETLDSGKKAFTSKEQDISGLYYYGARYYNPIIGR